MQKGIIYIGLDVDDQSFHGSWLCKETGETQDFQCHPRVSSLSKSLGKIQKQFPSHTLSICYEATYLGFSLQRELVDLGYTCDVIAVSSIPRVHGNSIKTDRIDASKLASFYAAGLLSVIDVPDVEQEQDRDLMRSRQYILGQLTKIRTHIQSLLRRKNLHFKSETQHRTHWTSLHMSWLDKKIDEATGSFKVNLSLLVRQMKWLVHTLKEYDEAVDKLAESPRYKKAVDSLVVYRGIKNIFALVMITEIGNIKRFDHPRKLVSWMGMDIREYSSGGQHNRFGITKNGNKYLRSAFVEANQKTFRSSLIGKGLRLRRKNKDPELVLIADRCIKRLVKKGNRLLHAGKHINKIKVACAREMVGFVWESLNKVA